MDLDKLMNGEAACYQFVLSSNFFSYFSYLLKKTYYIPVLFSLFFTCLSYFITCLVLCFYLLPTTGELLAGSLFFISLSTNRFIMHIIHT